ncbi:MAG: oligoribonuclease [Corynebacterium sp.]|nr:oligoribonuclease [Corynebacterium sp.]
MIPKSINRLMWIDLEMTGLDTHRHVIVEVAAVMTDAELNVLGEGIDLVVHASEEELAQMDEFVVEMHTKSGLLDQIKASTVSIQEAEQAVLDLLAKHSDGEHPVPLCGNSIGTDRTFIREYMPTLDKTLHYRMIDVSTIKELSNRWAPKAFEGRPVKGLAHRALADILESIEELDYYRRALFPAKDISKEDANRAAAASVQRYKDLIAKANESAH